ncbi:MAG: hypothetical protein ACOYL6_01735 [Bacteriovoracaceae bacterium]
MKLADCVEEIKKIYFGEDTNEALNKFVFYLLQEIKYKHFLGTEYPRAGWLLSFEQESLRLVHKDARISVDDMIKKSIPGAKNYLYLYGQQPKSV